ncbi:VPLPA-CTERM sorting domain-containing protein [Marinovum sp.]|uniref:VPLPA-CTERM sorting domain-containing protein n=1 Tax=Marinovum sp. TaxID=2024839 RepID=UPI003A91090F
MLIKKILCAAALAFAGTTANAAPLDLTAFLEGPAVPGTAPGVLLFDPVFGLEVDFFAPLPLANGTDITFLYDGVIDIFDVLTLPFGPLDFYNITEVGFTPDTLEFLLTIDPGSGPGPVFGPHAVARFTSPDFDFLFLPPGADPLTSLSLPAYPLASYSVSPLALVTPIPLPAGLPLLLSGLAGLVVLRRRKRLG